MSPAPQRERRPWLLVVLTAALLVITGYGGWRVATTPVTGTEVPQRLTLESTLR